MLDQEILASLANRGIKAGYHFIGLDYLPNVIRRAGLWCAKCLRDWGDAFDDDPCKWGSCDRGLAFSSFLSCSINPPMGMMTRSKRPVILELDASVAALPGVVFIGKWSSFKDVVPEISLAQRGVEWFDKMFLSPMTSFASPHPGEFLVPRHIALRNVHRVVFFSQEDLDETRRSLSDLPRPQGLGPIRVSVNAPLFGRKMREEEQ